MLFAFLVANWILQGKKAFHFSSLKSNLPLISLIIFFVWHLLGMIWSSNQSFGWFDIQIKLPFLLLPLVFSNMQRLKVNQFQNVLMAFLWGCIVAILIGFGNAIYAYASGITPFLDFYDINISPLLHISYFAMYLNLALVISLYLIITRERDFYSLGNALLIILAFAFALMVYLTTSRNGFITLVLLLLLIVLYAIMRYRKWLLGISMVLFAWILATAFFKDLSTIGSGAHNFNKVQEILKSEEGVSKEEGGSVGVRILIWKSSWELISKNP
jgi:O-antigen ligase